METPTSLHDATGYSGDAECKPLECAVCQQIGRLGEQCSAEYVDAFGKDMPGAKMTPTGKWVCSKPCQSQLMFESSGPRMQSLLQRYHVAVAEMADVCTPELLALLERWDCDGDIRSAPLDDALRGIAATPSRSFRQTPAWVEKNTAPADRMSQAITQALLRLEHRAIVRISTSIAFELRMAERGHGNPNAIVTHNQLAAALASIAREMQALAAARDGKESA